MRHFLGITRELFCPDIRVDELYHTAALKGAKERFLYAVNLGAISLVIGDTGSGKSTALRYIAQSFSILPGTRLSPSSPIPAPF
jgi:ABC-type nitrate/sulfonate/bicarbonate transport system ATPase subunit